MFYMDCSPHLDLSELTYDFSVEHQMLSHVLLKQCGSEDNDIECDDNSRQLFQEEHLIRQFGQQAVVAQEMFDFIGMESNGNQCSGAQDLISFWQSYDTICHDRCIECFTESPIVFGWK